jgi:ribosomal protein L11 methyltransferase
MPAHTAHGRMRVRLRPRPRDLSALNEARDKLDAIGGLLADEAGVGGVETRDPTTLDGGHSDELWVYAAPNAVAELEQQARALAARFGLDVEIASTVEETDDWRDRWKEFYRPFVVGTSSLLVRPSWIRRRDGDPEREIVLDPGRAFGTGLHETTQLCLEQLVQQFEAGQAFAQVLDLGCGSGILALAAARLFPSARVWAFDLDPEAAATTRENVAANRLEERVDVQCGDVGAGAGRRFDLVVANIRADVLAGAAEQLAACCTRTLVLGGILEEEADTVDRRYVSAGFSRAAQVDRAGWVALRYNGPAS